MKAISIDPNSGKYFVDRSDINFSDTMYQGTYNYTPVYPRYTFCNSGRFNYMNPQNDIEFITMLPINISSEEFAELVIFIDKKVLGKTLVESILIHSTDTTLVFQIKFCVKNFLKNLHP